MRKAVFLDRDGTLNEDPGYLDRPEKLKLLPGVARALQELKQEGFSLIVVSNQSGVGRGLIKRDAIEAIHARLNELLLEEQSQGENASLPPALIDSFELCLHTPEDQCSCRKPSPELLIHAALRKGLTLSTSFMVGDKYSDLEAGWAAGCRAAVLVRTGMGSETERGWLNPSASDAVQKKADFTAGTLADATRWILKISSS